MFCTKSKVEMLQLIVHSLVFIWYLLTQRNIYVKCNQLDGNNCPSIHPSILYHLSRFGLQGEQSKQGNHLLQFIQEDTSHYQACQQIISPTSPASALGPPASRTSPKYLILDLQDEVFWACPTRMPPPVYEASLSDTRTTSTGAF